MPLNNVYNDKELLTRLAAGDVVAYRFFFNVWWRKMFANALQFAKDEEQAKDMAQEVFIKIWVNREKLAELDSLENYLYFIARNIFLDHLKKKVLNTSNSLYLDAWFENASSVQVKMETAELEKLLQKAIEQLPPQMQTAFRLSRFEGLTHAEIATFMGISKTTSQSYIVRALLSIRKFMETHASLSECMIMVFLSEYFRVL